MKSNPLCVIPWIHLNVMPQGKVKHCCVGTDYNNDAGDLKKNTLEEIYNGEYIRKLRLQMLAGEKPSICSKCYESEDSSGESIRLGHNEFFKDKLEKIPEITNPDGTVDDVELSYWDFRFSNLCNLKCRTCSPECSSSWSNDAKAIKWFTPNYEDKVTSFSYPNFNISTLEKHLGKVKKIYFSGGEPLLMDEHWKILDMLDKHKKYDVTLCYNTNLSKINYGNKNILNYWKKWGQHAWIWPSIDEIDERAELVRSGTNWKHLEQNLLDISKIGIYVAPNITVSCMNAFRIPEIIDRLVELGIICSKMNYSNFNLNIVEYGPFFNVSIFSAQQKKEIKKKILKYVAEYRIKYKVNILKKFLHLFWHLDKPRDIKNVILFQEFTKKLDAVRNENIVSVIPELEEIMNFVPPNGEYSET